MARMRFRLPTWDEGRELMAEIGKGLDIQVEEQDDLLVIERDSLKITMKPDDRGFSFFMIRYSKEEQLEPIKPLISKYT